MQYKVFKKQLTTFFFQVEEKNIKCLFNVSIPRKLNNQYENMSIDIIKSIIKVKNKHWGGKYETINIFFST